MTFVPSIRMSLSFLILGEYAQKMCNRYGVFTPYGFLECSYNHKFFYNDGVLEKLVFHTLPLCYLNSLGRCSPFLVIFHPFLILFVLQEIDPQLTGEPFLFGDKLKWLPMKIFPDASVNLVQL